MAAEKVGKKAAQTVAKTGVQKADYSVVLRVAPTVGLKAEQMAVQKVH